MEDKKVEDILRLFKVKLPRKPKKRFINQRLNGRLKYWLVSRKIECGQLKGFPKINKGIKSNHKSKQHK